MTLYSARLTGYLQAVEEALPTYLPETDKPWGTVAAGMHYACEGGGKRLRPVLVLEFCRLCGGNPTAALPFACGLEMIHSYSLVHDDMACMDNSPLRRGKPSVHALYGEAMALLVGDGLLTRAFEAMLSPSSLEVPPERALAAAFTLADAAGIGGMVGGQTVDLESEGQAVSMDTLVTLQEGKTAALLMAACVMGAQLAGAAPEKVTAARAFGRELGHGFQIVDDILDATANADQLGKPVGGDAEAEKSTYVTLLGLEEARRLAKEHTTAALAALEIFGKEAEDLRQLATALLTRDH